MVVCLCVSPAIGWQPIQDVPCLLSLDSWDKFQQTPATHVWINQVKKVHGWTDGRKDGWMDGWKNFYIGTFIEVQNPKGDIMDQNLKMH